MFNTKPIDTQSIPPLQCDILADVTLLPMLGHVTKPTSVYGLGAYADKKPLSQVRRLLVNDERFFQLPYVNAWHISTQEVIYGGIFFMHWGHFLLENLRGLWYTKQCDLPIVWAGVHGFEHTPSQFKAWQSELFQALGIRNKHIFLTEPTRFAKVHFPEPGSDLYKYIHHQHVDFLGYYQCSTPREKYVYFSRSKIRGCTNEEQLEKLLKKHGWHIVYPEELSVAHKLKLLSSAKVCFMIGGSAQHSLLLTKHLQTRVIVIPRGHSETYNRIANLTSNNYFLFNVPQNVLHSDGCAANALFTLDLDIIEEALNKTNNFTTSLDLYPKLFTKPEKLSEHDIRLPASYRDPLPSLNKALKIFFYAKFFYLQKKYKAAYNLFIFLKKKDMLSEFMYHDFFETVQQYQIQNNLNITAPIEKHQYEIHNLQERIKKNTKDMDSYKALTKLYLIAGNLKQAMELQKKLMRLYPQWSKPLLKMAFIFAAQHDLDSAIACAQQAVEREPYSIKCKTELIGYLLKNKNYITCQKMITATLKEHPTWENGYAQLAAVHAAQGALDKAIVCVQKAISMAPHNLVIQEQLAEYLRQQGDDAGAITLLAKAMQQNPRQAEQYAQNACIYAAKGALNKAIEYAYKAVETEPRNFVCKAHLATYLRKNKDYTSAIEVMTTALHMNPFWSEPYAQFAAIHDAEENIDKAIDCARKAVATEPYNIVRKQELEQYRIKKLYKTLDKLTLSVFFEKRSTSICKRLQSYIDLFYTTTYLEVGFSQGETFSYIDVPYKVGVDPNCSLERMTKINNNEHCVVYKETSEKFFEHLQQRAAIWQEKYHDRSFNFDMIYIHASQNFVQTLRDFENTLPYSHEKTIWIIDNTAPTSLFTNIFSQAKEQTNLHFSENETNREHGFKTIFTIHNSYPNISYCTLMNQETRQTILWRTAPFIQRKQNVDLESVSHLNYEDFIKNIWMLNPVEDAEVLDIIFSDMNFSTDRTLLSKE